MARWLRHWWWIPSGILVAMAVGRALGGGWVLAAMIVYAVINLAGTGMLLREIGDQEEGPRSDRWRLLVQLAFVLQLPVGAAVLLVEIL